MSLRSRQGNQQCRPDHNCTETLSPRVVFEPVTLARINPHKHSRSVVVSGLRDPYTLS